MLIIFSDSKLQQKTSDSKLSIDSYKKCMNFIICCEATESCYFLKCNNCPGVEVLQEFLETIFVDDSEEIIYHQWVSQPKTTLETFIKDAPEFLQDFCSKMQNLLPHAFVAEQQTKYINDLKNNLMNGEFVILADFAENYAFIVQNAAPGHHWNNDQSTVYNIVIYFKENNTVNHLSLVIISDCLKHDAVAVYTFHDIAIQFLRDRFDKINKNYFTDGAPQQYKNYKNVFNLAYHFHDYKINAEWHFFPTAHGKGLMVWVPL